MAFPNKRNVTPRYQQISLIQQIELTNFNKFFLQIRRMMVYGFIKMLGFHLSKFDKESNVTYDLKKRK
jgi:hypothetical protein